MRPRNKRQAIRDARLLFLFLIFRIFFLRSLSFFDRGRSEELTKARARILCPDGLPGGPGNGHEGSGKKKKVGKRSERKCDRDASDGREVGSERRETRDGFRENWRKKKKKKKKNRCMGRDLGADGVWNAACANAQQEGSGAGLAVHSSLQRTGTAYRRQEGPPIRSNEGL